MFRTRRYAVLLGFCLAAAPLTLAAVVPPELVECVEGSAEHDSHDGCPPACGCACHAPRRVRVESAELIARPLLSGRRLPRNDEAPVSPEPRPIRHVPKRAG